MPDLSVWPRTHKPPLNERGRTAIVNRHPAQDIQSIPAMDVLRGRKGVIVPNTAIIACLWRAVMRQDVPDQAEWPPHDEAGDRALQRVLVSESPLDWHERGNRRLIDWIGRVVGVTRIKVSVEEGWDYVQ